MTIKFKEVLNNKFWIVEEAGEKVGTVSFNDDQYMLSDASGTHFLKKKDLKKSIKIIDSVSFKKKLQFKDFKFTPGAKKRIEDLGGSAS